MSEDNTKQKTGPKGPRNTVKQVLLIEGHPDTIFYNNQEKRYSIKLYKGFLKLGSLGPDKVKELRDLLGKRVIEEMTTKRKRVKIPGVISVKTTRTSTSLTVAAASQEELDKRVIEIMNMMGVPVQERCKWVCEIDKGKIGKQISEVQAYDLAVPPQTTAKEEATKPRAILQPEPGEKEQVTPVKMMSKRTLQLREIALKAVAGRT